ncbi:MAG: hypothetical protein V7606_484 [Burkholderiales bacterium]|jgi:hypothetical protein
MEHRTLDEMSRIATIVPAPNLSRRAVRRQRLNRLADLLSTHMGPIRLLTRIEDVPRVQRRALRGEFSPLALAYADVEFRWAGLAGDTIGDAMAFFDLSDNEVHTLFCDCNYGMSSVQLSTIAARVRGVANRLSARERWENIRAHFGSKGVRTWHTTTLTD